MDDWPSHPDRRPGNGGGPGRNVGQWARKHSRGRSGPLACPSFPFKAGFVAIAVAAEKRLGARVPIVPAGFRYTKARHWRAELHIGKAVYVEDWGSRRSLIERMERRIAELSGLSATRPQPKD